MSAATSVTWALMGVRGGFASEPLLIRRRPVERGDADVGVVLSDHRRGPARHGGHEPCRISQRHRLLVRLPVVLPLRNGLQHAARPGRLPLQFSQQQLGDRGHWTFLPSYWTKKLKVTV